MKVKDMMDTIAKQQAELAQYQSLRSLIQDVLNLPVAHSKQRHASNMALLKQQLAELPPYECPDCVRLHAMLDVASMELDSRAVEIAGLLAHINELELQVLALSAQKIVLEQGLSLEGPSPDDQHTPPQEFLGLDTMINEGHIDIVEGEPCQEPA